jgi:hypothetical protein
MNRWDQFRLAVQLFYFAFCLGSYGVGAVVARLFSNNLVTMFIGGVIGILVFTCYAVLRWEWGNPTAAQMIGLLAVPAIVAGVIGPLVTILIVKFPGTAAAIALALTIVFFFAFARA